MCIRDRDKTSNEVIRGKMEQDIERMRLIWYVHRMEDEGLQNKMMQWFPPYRQKGRRQSESWKEVIPYRFVSARDLRKGSWNDRIAWMLGIT